MLRDATSGSFRLLGLRYKSMSPVRLPLLLLLLWATQTQQNDIDLMLDLLRQHIVTTGTVMEDVKLLTMSMEQMAQKMDTLEANVTQKMDALEANVTQKMDALEATVTQKMDTLEANVTQKIAALEGTVADIMDKIEDEMTEQSKKIADEMAKQTGCVEYASPVPEIKALNRRPGTWLNVFTSYRIKKAGRLARWKYFAAWGGTVHLDIWRKRSDGQLELVGFNKVVCEGPGYWEYVVPCDEQILVQVGDMFGVHYPKSAEALDKGVVYYEGSWGPPTSAENSRWLLSAVNLELFDDTLTEGATISDDTHASKTVALGADIYC